MEELTELKDCIGRYLCVECESLDALVEWCKSVSTEVGINKLEKFKRELRHAIDSPGAVTPEIYEQWTLGAELNDQSEVQRILGDIWKACFQ